MGYFSKSDSEVSWGTSTSPTPKYGLIRVETEMGSELRFRNILEMDCGVVVGVGGRTEFRSDRICSGMRSGNIPELVAESCVLLQTLSWLGLLVGCFFTSPWVIPNSLLVGLTVLVTVSL